MKANWLASPGVHSATHRYRPVRLTNCPDAPVATRAADTATALRSTLIALLLTHTHRGHSLQKPRYCIVTASVPLPTFVPLCSTHSTNVGSKGTLATLLVWLVRC